MAADANGTCHFTPSRRKASPSALASMTTPFGPNPRSGSSHATVTISSPVAIFGSHVLFCASDPPRRIAPALITALTKCGDGESERPNSS